MDWLMPSPSVALWQRFVASFPRCSNTLQEAEAAATPAAAATGGEDEEEPTAE